jgi:PleD family two-component response regulator
MLTRIQHVQIIRRLIMNVLIIDNDADDTFIFCEILKDIYPSANCVVASDCVSTLATVEKMEVPVFIFLDAHMPPDGGLQCLWELKTLIDPEKTRIMIYSDELSPRKKEEFKALGAHDFVIKTGDLAELKSRLQHTIADYMPS